MKKMKWLVLFFVVLFFGCSPKNTNSEQLSTPQIDPEIVYDNMPVDRPLNIDNVPVNIDNMPVMTYADMPEFEQNMVPCVMTAPGVLHKSSTFNTTAIIPAVLVYVEEGYFGEEKSQEEQSRNVGDFNPEEPPEQYLPFGR